MRINSMHAFAAYLLFTFSAPAAAPQSAPTVPTGTGSAAATGTTSINIGLAGSGRPFGGIGAISGGGGNSRLLIDYPEKQRGEILDYLFKPGYGASLQILKIEIGGDANSTDGSEPSVEHTQGVVNCNAGYEFWLAEQAKQRNPNIKLYGLAWTAPGWIGGGNFWSHDMIDYLMTWLDCAHSHHLAINYLGGWNERDYDAGWYKDLHAALAAKHPEIQVVGDDSDWKIADAMAKDPALARSIDIIGAHYSCEGGDGGSANSCSSTETARGLGKPLWDSESGSQDDNTGTGPLIRAITRGYLDGKMTALLNWPVIAAITPNLPYPTVGLMVAGEPWSGNYSIGQSLWATAQVTQFTRPGWLFLDQASGYLGQDRTRGSFISLRSPDNADVSSIVETTTASAPSTVQFRLSGAPAGKQVHVWSSNLGSAAANDQFTHQADLNQDGSGRFEFTLQPKHIYTFSTLATGGKGNAATSSKSALKLPYRDDFDRYQPGEEARYFSDMQGAFEVQPCAGDRKGKCLQQMAPVKPIEWQDDSDAFTLVGDPSWTNYTVSVDAELAKPGTLELIGRAGTQKRPQSHQQGYYFQVASSGTWTLLKSDAKGVRTKLGSGATEPLATGRWYRLELRFDQDQLTASVNGKALASLRDSSYAAGQVGLGLTSYDTDQFDNLAVTPLGPAKPPLPQGQ